MPRIDIHHHFFPESLTKLKGLANLDLGWKTPTGNLDWSPELSIRAMDASNIEMAILSFPALASGNVSEENRSQARKMNLFVSKICQTYPSRFGFFGTLPFLDDIEGSLKEIAFALDDLGADGIAMSSSCGEGDTAKYIGNDIYDTIWAELDRRKAVVFLHGAQTPSSTPYPHPFLGIPITEVPNETFKAAAHLVVTGRKRKYHNIKIILAHMGGTVPLLAARVAILSSYMGCLLTPEEILEDFQSFYFDTALSAYGPSLVGMNAFVPVDRLLFGSDFPAVDTCMAGWYTKNLEEHYATEQEKLDKINYKNALGIFPGKRHIFQGT